MSGCEINSCGSGQRKVAGTCEHGNEASGATKIRKCVKLPEELSASQGLYSCTYLHAPDYRILHAKI
jgi:hypothetical protein